MSRMSTRIALIPVPIHGTATTGGVLYTTFTPLAGSSDVVKSFLEPDSDEARVVKRGDSGFAGDFLALLLWVRAAHRVLALEKPSKRNLPVLRQGRQRQEWVNQFRSLQSA